MFCPSNCEFQTLKCRFCNIFLESSTGSWAELQLPCCPSKQGELPENMLRNLLLNLPPQTVAEASSTAPRLFPYLLSLMCLHARFLSLLPRPHLTEHSPHSDHVVHSAFGGQASRLQKSIMVAAPSQVIRVWNRVPCSKARE